MTNKNFYQFNIDTTGICSKEEQLNQYGFRGAITNSKKKILFAGCSMTFGAGVDYCHTFTNQTSEILGDEWSCVNIGIPGSGPNEQITAITWALNNFKIDTICWYMSDPMRTTLMMNELRQRRITLSDDFQGTTDLKIKKDIELFIKHHLYFEKNYLKDLKNNIYTLFSLIKHKNIDCYVSCWITSFDKELQKFRDEFDFKELGDINWLDIGFDNVHPGPISHLDFANRIVERIKNE